MKKTITLFFLSVLIAGATVPVPTYLGSSGLVQINVKVSDVLGISDLDWVDISIGSPGANSCMVQWNRGNYWWLFADNGSTALGGILQGTNTTIQNTQCKLKIATTNATIIGGDLYLWIDIQCLAYTGMKTVWMVAGGSQGHDGWHAGGSVLAGQSAIPTVSLSSPAAGGTGITQNFTVQIVNTAGIADISWMNFTVGPVGANSCMLQWGPGEYLQLFQDNGNSMAGGGTAGSGGTVQNSRCQLNLAGSSGSTSGPNTKYVTFALTLLSPSAGVQPMYAVAGSPAGNGGWANLGNWTVPGGITQIPDTALSQIYHHPGEFPDDAATDNYTGAATFLPTTLSPAPAVTLVGNQTTVHPGDAVSISVRWAKPNTSVYVSFSADSLQDLNCVADPPNCVSLNGGGLAGTTDSTGYFLYSQAVGTVNPILGGRTYHVYVTNEASPTQPKFEIGATPVWVQGFDGLPATPNYSAVRTSKGAKRYPRAEQFAVYPPSSSYKQVGKQWEYTLDLDTTTAKMINVGDDRGYTGEPADDNPNFQDQNGYTGGGGTFSAKDNTPRSQHSVFKLVTDWMPGPVSVMFSAGMPKMDVEAWSSYEDSIAILNATGMRKNSVRRNVIGPAIPPGSTDKVLARLIREWVDEGNLFLAPLTGAGLDLRAELGKLNPSEGYEQSVIDCIRAALGVN